MSNNKQSVELTDVTVPILAATQGLIIEDHVSIGILLECAKRGETRGKQPSPSICKVSRILRDHSESSYEPLLVSVGPLHREDPKLKEFEWQKERYLNDLLKRCHNSTPNKTLEACLLKVNTLIDQIRESYAGVKKKYSDVDFAKMMVMDGFFILEFCFKHEDEDSDLQNKMQNLRIAMDLMLLENQVPLFVLQALFDCSMGKVSFTLSNVLDQYLAPYIKLLFRSQLREEIPTTYVDSDSTDHVLGYLHRRYQLVVAKSSNNPKYAEASKPVDEELAAKSSNPIPADAEASKPVNEERIDNTYAAFHSIVELEISGVNFKPHQEDVWSMTIKFQSSLLASWFGSKATLLMPTLVIDKFTELILRNFIAYEQSFPQDHYYFSSYAHAMDMLIDTQEDIAKLVESEVLVNDLGSNQEAADMINRICKNVFVKDFYYTEEFKQMDEYYNHYWSKKIAWLSRDFARVRHAYLNNSWKVIAVLGALVLFGLTMIQTIYTIRAA